MTDKIRNEAHAGVHLSRIGCVRHHPGDAGVYIGDYSSAIYVFVHANQNNADRLREAADAMDVVVRRNEVAEAKGGAA